VAALFRRMQVIYGPRWTASIEGIEEDAIREWSRGLADMTPDNIRRGLDACQSSGDGWPPTLPEFLALCRGTATNGFGLDYIPEYHRQRDPARLLDAPRNAETAKAALREIRELLRGGEVKR